MLHLFILKKNYFPSVFFVVDYPMHFLRNIQISHRTNGKNKRDNKKNDNYYYIHIYLLCHSREGGNLD